MARPASLALARRASVYGIARFGYAVSVVVAFAALASACTDDETSATRSIVASTGATDGLRLTGALTRIFRGGVHNRERFSAADVAAWVGCVDMPGAGVAVRDASGDVVGTAGTGQVGFPSADRCVVRFAVNVPRSSRYKIDIGSFESRPYTFEELQSAQFDLKLDETIGVEALRGG